MNRRTRKTMRILSQDWRIHFYQIVCPKIGAILLHAINLMFFIVVKITPQYNNQAPILYEH